MALEIFYTFSPIMLGILLYFASDKLSMLEDYNPWWSKSADFIYEKWKDSEISWIPDILKSFSFAPFSLHFLVGPRQVGKSTTLRIYIHQLIEKGFESTKICYLPCDRILDFRELQGNIQEFLDPKSGEQLLILDEITFVDEWWRAIKDFIDRGLFDNMVVFVSGSASMELLKQREYFPGRLGDGKDFILHPLDFNEYVRHIGGLDPDNRFMQHSVMEFLKKHRLQSSSIRKLFDQYLITGGFPHAIIEYTCDKKVTYRSYNVYIDWIKNDFVKLGKNEGYLKGIIHAILSSVGSPVSYMGIAKNTVISSST
ncbi:MAG: ATP-binding protein, partial [Candidatus Kariarchaeaceae archaeon]